MLNIAPGIWSAHSKPELLSVHTGGHELLHVERLSRAGDSRQYEVATVYFLPHPSPTHLFPTFSETSPAWKAGS